ncbi:MAG: Flp pilus assembly complex ATPase component TadA [candidate division Zixibacteria bacterium]|nr:Flp pilus assembly complex ATPase component TadA [candidate division Zixibacteria bacterium]
MAIKKIGELLVDKNLITPTQLKQAINEQKTSGKRLGEVVVDMNLVTEEQLLEVISERLKTPKVTLESIIIDPHIIQTVPVELARRYTLIPVFRIGNTLTVAMADPLNVIAVDELAYTTGCDIHRSIAPAPSIKKAIEHYYSVQDRLRSVIRTYDRASEPTESSRAMSADDDSNENQSPVVKLVNIILSKAVRDGASDIHFEPNEGLLRVRYRIHGKMREEVSPPKSLQAEVISSIKIAAEMDVSEKRVPQDGRFAVRVDDSTIDLRVSTLPTIHGEKIVIRILDPRNLNMGLEDLGLSGDTLNDWRKMIRRSDGLILISGPTSSGKTSTLYSTLQEINSIEKNIITVEDPVEYSLPMINQIQTNEKAGLTFANLLRSIVRQNPDIIMVGEIRDTDTARMAVGSALTGHLVFSTIHTNDSASSVTRLVDMGVAPYLVASALKGIMAQRLVQVNCPDCLEEYRPLESMIEFAGLSSNSIFRRSTGCTKCRLTRHRGMTGLFELLKVDGRIKEMIVNGDSDATIRDYGQTQGTRSLFDEGTLKLADGLITLEELLRSAAPETSRFGSSTTATYQAQNI